MTALFEVRWKAKSILKRVTDCFVKEEKHFLGERFQQKFNETAKPKKNKEKL